MAVYRALTKTSAKKKAKMMRKKGLAVSIYKRRKGGGVSVTRK